MAYLTKRYYTTVAIKYRLIQDRSMNDDRKFKKQLQILAQNLKRIRDDRGFTQEDMMNFGFERRYYQRLESGDVNPTLFTIFRLAQSLGVEPWSLLKRPRIKK